MKIKEINERFTVTLKVVALQQVELAPQNDDEPFSEYSSVSEVLPTIIGFHILDHKVRESHSIDFDKPKNEEETQVIIWEEINRIVGGNIMNIEEINERFIIRLNVLAQQQVELAPQNDDEPFSEYYSVSEVLPLNQGFSIFDNKKRENHTVDFDKPKNEEETKAIIWEEISRILGEDKKNS